jgi:hypothetical protein
MVDKPGDVDSSRFEVQVSLVNYFCLVGIFFFANEQYASNYFQLIAPYVYPSPSPRRIEFD